MGVSDLVWVRFARQPHLATERFEMQERLSPDEAVAADLLSADDTFKQKRIGPAVQLAKCAHRSECVAHELAIHGNDARLPAQINESFEFWMMGHGCVAGEFLSVASGIQNSRGRINSIYILPCPFCNLQFSSVAVSERGVFRALPQQLC